MGLIVESETYQDWLINCPFHGGTNDPSMTVSKELGLYNCFNPACAEAGNLLKLVMFVKSCNAFTATRFITKFEVDDVSSFEKTLQKTLAPVVMPTFSTEVIDKMHTDLHHHQEALEYLYSRGLKDETIQHFKLGYSVKQNLVVTPMHDFQANPVGVIGRTIVGKRFQNSKGLPVRETLFNVHRAKRIGSSVVVTESNFDALRVWQAGHECVVATLGGTLGERKIEQLNKYFDSVIILTDDDEPQYHLRCRKCLNDGKKTCQGHQPGLDLGRSIEAALSNKPVYWAHTGEGRRRLFEKDAGAMTDFQIQTCIKNKISRFEARQMV